MDEAYFSFLDGFLSNDEDGGQSGGEEKEEKVEASVEATSGKLQLATSFVLGTLARADQEELLVQWTEKLEGMYGTDPSSSLWLLNWLMTDKASLKGILLNVFSLMFSLCSVWKFSLY